MTNDRLTNLEKEFIEKCGTSLHFNAGEAIYRKGDPADQTYYIKKGRVRIWNKVPSGREMTLDVIETGHIFGESAFASDAARPVYVHAVTDTTLIAFQMKELLKKCPDCPTFALHLLQLTSDSMDRLTERVEEQFLLDRYGKTASYLLDRISDQNEDKGTLDNIVPYTHEELAFAIGLNRTTVTEVLKYFSQKHWISCEYKKIQVLNPEKLQEFVNSQKGI